MRSTPQPVAVGLAEKPNPGSDGQITWNASAASPPWAVGLLSGFCLMSGLRGWWER